MKLLNYAVLRESSILYKQEARFLCNVIAMTDHFFLQEILGTDLNGQFNSQLPFSSVSKRVLFRNISHDNEFDLHYENERASEHIYRDWFLFLPFL